MWDFKRWRQCFIQRYSYTGDTFGIWRVVPEIASREHNKFIYEIVEKALNNAKVRMDDIDLIGITNGPGLIGALMVGIAFAKGLAMNYKNPLLQ